MTLDLGSSPIGGISRVSRRSRTYCPHGSSGLRRFSSTERSIALSIASADFLDGTEDRLNEERSLSQPYGSMKMSRFRSHRQKRTIIDRREVGINQWVFSTNLDERPRIDIAICGLMIPDASVSFRSDLPSVPGMRANRALRLILI